jgi:hypothetical protein
VVRLRHGAILGFVLATAAIVFGSKDDSLVQQVPAACVPPAFGDPPIVRPVDQATDGQSTAPIRLENPSGL